MAELIAGYDPEKQTDNKGDKKIKTIRLMIFFGNFH
jgi:hypothetical protein